MPNIRNFLRSFAGGEISPEMLGRIDDGKYQTGLALCKNFLVRPQGAIENRPGTAFVREVKDSTKRVRLIPFTYSTTQTMVLEMGAGYFRFHTQGGTLLSPTPSAWVTSTVYAVGDLVLSSGANYYCKTAHTSGTFATDLAKGYWHEMPDSLYEIPNPYAEADLFDIHYVQSADVLTLTHPSYTAIEVRRVSATKWTAQKLILGLWSTPPTGVTAVSAGHTSEKYTYRYVVTAVAADGFRETEASSEASDGGNLFETGCTVTVSWTALTGASLYKVYKKQGGIYGYIGQTSTTSLVDDNIAPDMSMTPPVLDSALRTSGIGSVAVTTGGTGYSDVYVGGGISSVSITYGGWGVPTNIRIVDLAGTGSGAVLTWSTSYFTWGGHRYYYLTSISVSTAGVGYQNPIVVFDYSWKNDYPATATATATAITVRPTEIHVTDTTGSGAVLTPIISAGVIQSIRVDDPGAFYTAPSVSIYSPDCGSGGTLGAVVLEEAFRPGAVSYFEQRRCFAGTIDQPQQVWMTKSGTESDMTYSLPIQDDDRISVRVAAREANTIRHIVPLSQLLLLTSAAEWRVTSVNSDAITPTSISVKPQSYVGASNMQPIIINNSLIYGAARGGHVRELGYNWQANGFVTGDVSLRASHLFDYYELVDMAYSKAPQPMVWFVSTSGKLLGLTYVPEQQIGAWHQHETINGDFESCVAVAEGDEDVLYVVVNRYFEGVGSKRYVERLASRVFEVQAEAFFVDSGLTFDGTNTSSTGITVTGGTTWGPGEDLTLTATATLFVDPDDIGKKIVLFDPTSQGSYWFTITDVTSGTVATAQVDRVLAVGLRGLITTHWARVYATLSGLDHLEGATVSIVADGAVLSPQVVTSGEITLDQEGIVVHVGLPITADMQTLPLALQVDHAFGQGRLKNINHACLRVYRSSGIYVGPNEDQLLEIKPRTTEVYGTPPELRTEEVEIMLSPSWTEDGAIFVRQTDPLPLTILAMTLEVSLGG